MSEHKMTKKDQEEKEDIVKGMKKNFSDFRKRYGKDAKDVMYATATKMAMKKEEVDSPNQYIDKKLYHDIFGEGLVLNDFSQINEQGKIDWYSVKFNHGIETAFTEDIEEMIDRYNQINEIDLTHSDPKKHARNSIIMILEEKQLKLEKKKVKHLIAMVLIQVIMKEVIIV